VHAVCFIADMKKHKQCYHEERGEICSSGLDHGGGTYQGKGRGREERARCSEAEMEVKGRRDKKAIEAKDEEDVNSADRMQVLCGRVREIWRLFFLFLFVSVVSLRWEDEKCAVT